LWQTFFIYFKNVSSDFCTESTLDWNPKNRYLETLEIRENLNSNSITEDRYLKSQKRGNKNKSLRGLDQKRAECRIQSIYKTNQGEGGLETRKEIYSSVPFLNSLIKDKLVLFLWKPKGKVFLQTV